MEIGDHGRSAALRGERYHRYLVTDCSTRGVSNDSERSVAPSPRPRAAIPVIDAWAPVVPSRELIDHIAVNFPVEQLQYLEVFTKTSIKAEQFTEYAQALLRDDAEILRALDEAGIVRSLITGFDETGSVGKKFVSNDAVAALAERYPKRFIPFAGVDITRGSDAVHELHHLVTERCFRGLSLRPFMIGRPATDPAYQPFYAKCVELGIPLSIHTSANWTRTRSSELGHPRFIDEIACQFPDLVILMSHGGYPWVLDACMIAWKHRNVFLELAAHRPRYFTSPGAGWEPLMRFGQSTIADKIIYGSGAFLINRPYSELIDEMCRLPISDATLEKWLWRNATRALGLAEHEVIPEVGADPTP
ncbi:MAG: amidohydrolase family protein [Solirubrobacteraceae bacterium]